MLDTREDSVGAFSGLVAGILVLALTVMAFTALGPPPERDHAANWNVSLSQVSPAVEPSF